MRLIFFAVVCASPNINNPSAGSRHSTFCVFRGFGDGMKNIRVLFSHYADISDICYLRREN